MGALKKGLNYHGMEKKKLEKENLEIERTRNLKEQMAEELKQGSGSYADKEDEAKKEQQK